jgi:hypothetical protein
MEQDAAYQRLARASHTRRPIDLSVHSRAEKIPRALERRLYKTADAP